MSLFPERNCISCDKPMDCTSRLLTYDLRVRIKSAGFWSLRKG